MIRIASAVAAIALLALHPVSPVFTLPSVVYQNPPSARPGAGGQQLFVFHASGSGTTTIAFEYARPWEKNASPAKSVSFTVTVF